MNDAKSILLRILEIIGYAEDKEKFATQFLQNVSLQTLLDLFNTLPQDKKGQIQKLFASAGNNPQAVIDILRNYFTEPQIEDGLQNASKNAVTEYMKAINPTLSEAQKTNIVNMAHELNQNNAIQKPAA